MPTPLTLDGRSLSQTTRVADLRATDLVPLVRPSEPLPDDQNVSIRADRLQALLGTGAVAAPPGVTLYDKLGIHTDGAATQRLVNEVADAAVRVPNLRPMGHAVTADFVSTPGWGVGSSSLADLPVDTLFIGTTAVAIYSVAGRFRTYVVADDPQGPLSVWRDGLLSGTRIQASWVLSDAPQAIATAYTSIDGTTYVWKLRQFASAYVGSPLAIQFFQARTAAVHPAPTDGGDPVHWEPISSQVIVPPTAAPLYASQGPYTDGAMTQRATTDALSARFNNRGAWMANTLYQANDAVSISGTTYYRTGAAFTSGAAFDPTNWVSFGAPAVNNLTTSATSNVAPPTIDAVNNALVYVNADAGGNRNIMVAGQNLPALPANDASTFDNFFPISGTGNIYGTGLANNRFGYLNFNNNYGNGMKHCVFGANVRRIITGINVVSCRIGDNCVNVTFGDNCQRVEVYNCSGITGTPFVIPTGTTDAVYRNNLLVSAGGDSFAVLPYPTGGAIAVDFNTATVRTIAAAGNLAYGASLNVALLRTKEHYLTNTSGAAITLSFPPGWSFFPGPAPTSLAAGKQAVLTLRSLGTDDSTIKAAYVAQA